MAASKTVIVLAPNGRRQNVKVTLNTTILQVLEEVCRKQGYNVDDYDIKHIHRILDPNTIFRFTGLSNNAQLEMVACAKTRTTSNVTIGIQPEDGERIMREYPPNATLAQALMDVYPDSDLENAVLIYMHREVCGREALEKTTLRSLGLNSGKAILRLIYRDLDRLKTQAHVSTPLLPKLAMAVDDNKNCQRVPLSIPHCNETIDDATVSMKNVPNVGIHKKSGATKMNVEKCEMEIDMEDRRVNMEHESQETDTLTIEETPSVVLIQKDCDIKDKDQNTMETCVKIQEDAYKIEFLGERNALVFDQAEAQALPRDDLPDSFFDLDLHDARILMRDAKRRREQLEDAPLLTEAQRQLDQDKRTLDYLNKYRRTVIRVQFPDQFILQGLFGPLESVQTVKDFIKNYLDKPDKEFTIYTAPPKHILNPDARLIDENLIPSAIVYYSGQSSLKLNVKTKLTDPRAANIEAARVRIGTTWKGQDSTTRDDKDTVVESKIDYVNPEPSGSGSSSLTQNQNRTPKWYKKAFK